MRAVFRAELDELISDLARIVRVAAQMMTDASSALHHGDLTLAEGVIASDDRMTVTLREVEQRCVLLLTLQAPVATDFRMLIVALRAVGELERMSALAQHVAKIVRLKHPRTPIPDGIAPVSVRMSVLAARLAHDAAGTIEARDPLSADRLAQADDEVDALRDHLLGVLVAPDWPYGVEPAVDAALIGRYYERFADHAVSLAGQVCYLVTGEYPNPATGSAPPDPDRPAMMLTRPTRPRALAKTSAQVIEADGVVLDVARRRAYVDGYLVHFPAREAALLGVLMARAGQVVYRAALADAAGTADQPQHRALDRLIHRLRRRLQPSPLSPARLHRVGDSGYRFGPVPKPHASST
ncbi:MAG: phosphate signaling complex protein PhoU [Pseudonocardiales bacterium]|nr:phosphate signaling complex protein PhoU [Pseudonocardiales bacterium]MBV9728681.1 phosphate signaling complex protein PhoU [Pseudonocardiales bacterium]